MLKQSSALGTSLAISRVFISFHTDSGLSKAVEEGWLAVEHPALAKIIVSKRHSMNRAKIKFFMIKC
jgi:hypothetical protein